MDTQTTTATIGHNSKAFSEILTEDPQALYREPELRSTLYAEIEENISAATVDLTTVAGRKEVASRAYAIAQLKSLLDTAGKNRTIEHREAIAAVDEIRRDVRNTLDIYRDKAREPLAKWEAEQLAKADKIEAEKVHIRSLPQFTGRVDATVEEIEDTIATLEAMAFPVDFYGNEANVLEALREISLGSARSSLEAAKVRVAEAAELARLRKAEGERLAKEAEEARQKAAKEAEEAREAAEKARAERIATEAREAAERAAKAEADAREAKAKREADAKLAAERAAKEAAERKLREAEEAAEAERKAQAKREADARHRELIQNEVAAGIVRVTGLSGAKATALIIAILAGEIPHTSIKF